MFISGYLGKRFVGELRQFVHERYGVTDHDIEEDPHVFSFFDYCADSPDRIDGRGRLTHIRRGLPEAAAAMREHLDAIEAPFRLSLRSIAYAEALRSTYASEALRAEPIYPQDVVDLALACDTSSAAGKRTKAYILTLWETWARPSELCRRRYPDDILADDDRGIALVLQRAKGWPAGERIEFLLMRHAQEQNLCAICALRDWLEANGEGYRGPLFVGQGERARRRGRSFTTFKHHLDKLSLALWGRRRFTAYSFRRGAATSAARNGWPPSAIKAKLRHQSIIQTTSYVDIDGLFNLVPDISKEFAL